MTINQRLTKLEESQRTELLITDFRMIADDQDQQHHADMLEQGYSLVRNADGFKLWVGERVKNEQS